jgi:hypothetical protein
MNRKLATNFIGGLFALLAFVTISASATTHETPTVQATEVATAAAVTTDGGLEWG